MARVPVTERSLGIDTREPVLHGFNMQIDFRLGARRNGPAISRAKLFHHRIDIHHVMVPMARALRFDPFGEIAFFLNLDEELQVLLRCLEVGSELLGVYKVANCAGRTVHSFGLRMGLDVAETLVTLERASPSKRVNAAGAGPPGMDGTPFRAEEDARTGFIADVFQIDAIVREFTDKLAGRDLLNLGETNEVVRRKRDALTMAASGAAATNVGEWRFPSEGKRLRIGEVYCFSILPDHVQMVFPSPPGDFGGAQSLTVIAAFGTASNLTVASFGMITDFTRLASLPR
jgi:hypothetical protein